MKIRLNLALWIIPVLLYSYSNITYAATFTQIAELQGQSPIEMDQGAQLPGFVDFGFDFETIYFRINGPLRNEANQKVIHLISKF